MAKSYKEMMNDITTFIFDVDGVLTDSSVFVTTEGEILRTMNIRDGYAMKAAVESGYHVCIISGGSNEGVRVRLKNLGIKDIHLGTPDKVKTFEEYTKTYNIKPEQVLYMGDDIPDYHVMKLVSLPACPQDAVPEIKNICRYISHVKGGKGAARDVIEQVMKVQGKWMEHFNGQHD
ncbi:HAD-IIIA family hydrolase [Flavobacterium sp. WLB]|uniref:KdsC family phosphatase n=1 Tax=unclassified Flavobacterium TaxID=196869 RepID=UPI0006ABB3BA|nr:MULTISPECIES: HAD-IIIA family hydrolase [unclassified Flavobacterium]KOP35988.1 3-deoxy-D-manno-octulosonate 8-phosphate phosphatase [Flavobacterium sp. VMW]OWU89691.1 3-deoxy-D-manno-octulosonate 8-phosphate phosphatase [Flavobacterium sp. NLM]PUU68318.1 HAD-IIIA family hydrolase [Flavobacterium sp. WLB]